MKLDTEVILAAVKIAPVWLLGVLDYFLELFLHNQLVKNVIVEDVGFPNSTAILYFFAATS